MNFTLRRKTYKHRCPDGSVKLIHRNIDDAFPLALKDVRAKIDLDLAALGDGSAGQVGTEYGESIAGLLYTLGDRNQSLMMSFRAVYAAYQSDPCANGDFFERQIATIVSETQRHTEIQVRLSGLIGLAQTDGINQGDALDLFRDLVREVGGPGVSTAAAQDIEQAKEAAQKWLDDTDGEGER